MRYNLAVFDLDGTLLNTLDDMMMSLNTALEANGFPICSRDKVREFVGDGIRTLVTKSLPPQTPEEKIEAVMKRYQEYYGTHKTDRTVPFPGVCETLDILKKNGIHLALVSNKTDETVQPLVEHYFPGVFDAVYGSKDSIRHKPYPDLVDAVLDQLAIPRDKAVYIGDSEYDFLTAENAGMDVILVTWGYREREVLEQMGAAAFAEQPFDLETMILCES